MLFVVFYISEQFVISQEELVSSDKLWEAAGRPRTGAIFAQRQSCKLRYRQCIRDHQRAANETYTNDLHEALLQKDGPN